MYRCFTNHNDDKVIYDKKIITINSNLFFSLALYIILCIFLSPLTFAFFCYFILKLNFSFAVIFMQIYGASFVAPSIYSFSVDIYLNHNAVFAFFLFAHLSCEKKNCQFQNTTDEIIWIFAIFVANSNEYFALVKLTYFAIIVAFTKVKMDENEYTANSETNVVISNEILCTR